MDDTEIDSTDVAALMGFGSFGGQKKRKLDLVSLDTEPNPTAAAQQQAGNTQSIRKAAEGNKSKGESREAETDTTNKPHAPNRNENGDFQQTQRSGNDRSGNALRNEHGDMAYFLPSFIEDPWKGLLEKRQS